MEQREFYVDLLKKHISNPKMIAHCLAAEAILRALARHFGEDEDIWGIAGLLHDLDVEITNADPKRHALVAAEMLEGVLPAEAVDAIKMHNEEATGLPRTTRFQHALAAGETIAGLIFATALVYPDKKIASVKPKSVTKRMKEKQFAASVNRETIMECEKIGIPINEFAQLSLEALVPIADEIGF
ncbi:HDIG domain-containing metalloprotein [Tenuifilum thalassicum]|uniref:HDIG domain-containing protein n=1 Tax=Tenuifilum thalassicum TaxID=2590900 RepID=A0A7D3XFS7_9BACT|nr:HDIG domain-containing metalloprotein [Tenuifilum thalassicum]QKG79637.1 HDIG domain-containing protein [Tenuifilum thalassicum]